MDKNYEKSIHRIGRIGVIIAIGFMPVSYTHLDVYKRQGFGIACTG